MIILRIASLKKTKPNKLWLSN